MTEVAVDQRFQYRNSNLPVSPTGELLLHGNSGGGIWINNTPLLNAHDAVLKNMALFLSDWRNWEPQKSQDTGGFTFISFGYTKDLNPLKELVHPLLVGSEYECPREDLKLVFRINFFSKNSVDQSFHNHRGPFASYIFHPDYQLGTPIYELTWGNNSNIENAQKDLLAVGSRYAIESYKAVHHQVAVRDDVFTVLLGVVPEGARDPSFGYSFLKNLGRQAALYNKVLDFFDPRGNIARMFNVDEHRKRQQQRPAGGLQASSGLDELQMP